MNKNLIKFNDFQPNRKINNRQNALNVLAKAKAQEAQQQTTQVYDSNTRTTRFIKVQNS